MVLLHLNAVLHNDDIVADGHGFFLVVGDEDGGNAGLFLDPADFLTGLQTKPGIEVALKAHPKAGHEASSPKPGR